MDEFEITPEAFASSLASDEATLKIARYQNATGQTGDGHGDMPQWLKQATSAGQTVDHFEVASNFAGARQKQTDWSRDPFARSRIAGNPAVNL
nr:hypothetical protein HUO10_005321 [Paraburkholderia busanensis]